MTGSNLKWPLLSTNATTTSKQQQQQLQQQQDAKHRRAVVKQLKSKLHRTDSHANLENLPNIEPRMISLAETHPNALGAKHEDAIEEQISLEETTKRCSEWLEDVAASRPFATDYDFTQGSGDEIEIPEETWIDFGHISSHRCDAAAATMTSSSSSRRKLQKKRHRSAGEHKTRQLKTSASDGDFTSSAQRCPTRFFFCSVPTVVLQRYSLRHCPHITNFYF